MWELKSHSYLFGSGQVKWQVNKNHKAAVQCQPYFVITLLFHQTGHMGGDLQSFCIPLEERYMPHQICPKVLQVQMILLISWSSPKCQRLSFTFESLTNNEVHFSPTLQHRLSSFPGKTVFHRGLRIHQIQFPCFAGLEIRT